MSDFPLQSVPSLYPDAAGHESSAGTETGPSPGPCPWPQTMPLPSPESPHSTDTYTLHPASSQASRIPARPARQRTLTPDLSPSP
ncbi:hypothetical protein CPAR01_03609 [Colletotrichum paranaense]|uniref:Uncharacterized protein n=4 Tax=Colletotrichum acutatum species complex TaxID=2707335 RepID=A0A9Q8WIN2_9PEZI|nr:uncharacterized protein CLUP02_10192 [Colletotrichum lupini]XP_060313178.1 uncharacterized protein CCOS01_08743 [Colletotrichum costaricense]XP_060352102.1 uncharacterized protein CPAR01_03609 [Colletotrichum paranaense]KAK1469399.1 hypothetical protein CMEL01_01166 [Colletotrichum melonis]KAK1526325.1 hypothetical protein CCOS01_08743 [Colletotrichum costaricense]KAK1542976.1 hypothetical protein CPAR01_03609 [Colletotrichum paranaense]UQC84696.1 hypothetical protein CLUP02_10192 [Colleto